MGDIYYEWITGKKEEKMNREEAIEFGNMWLDMNQDAKDSNTYQFFIMAIKALEQEPKTGHWIPLGNYDDWENENSYQCSECGERDTYPDNYCHNCGAKMTEESEE